MGCRRNDFASGRGRARLGRDRDGLLVFFVGVVLLRVAAAVYFLAHLLVAAAPVVMLASGVTIARSTAHASRRVVGERLGAGRTVGQGKHPEVGRVWRGVFDNFFCAA